MIWIAVGLVVLMPSGVCWYLARRADLRVRLLRTTGPSTVAELVESRRESWAEGRRVFRQRCGVTGVVRSHEDGTLTSEHGRIECVWHKHKVTETFLKVRADAELHGWNPIEAGMTTVALQTTDAAFLLEDDTGRLVIRPAGHAVEGAEKAVDRYVAVPPAEGLTSVQEVLRYGERTHGHREEEWVVRAGTRLFVHGEVSAEAEEPLVISAPADGGPFVMSARSRDQLLREEDGRRRAFRALAGVFTATGAVLLAVGAVTAFY
ncbi:GIDE domain-containing protein [Nocardiopsis sp. YSL2]|uniref:GIDE domain-containing protein n=1 Tax=Nocardiopsis sp. YSL2 TaxID=2939492 RepID=UPI0026F41021|nr:GIDE domain-containing protein [Nocardiopsis sp. YSL2]